MGTEHVVVVGAGQMGAGIAQVALQSGHRVTLVDVSRDLVDKGSERVQSGLQKLVDKVDAATRGNGDGANLNCLVARVAERVELAFRAERLSRRAKCAAVVDDLVRKQDPFFLGNDFL